MHVMDWLIMALTIITLIAAIREARRKEWLNFAGSLVIFLILAYIGRGIWTYLFQSVTGSTP